MIFEAFQLQVRSDIATGSYLVADEGTGRAAWIDPAQYDAAIVSKIRQAGWKPSALLLTHGHYDHRGGIAKAMQQFGCPLYCHASDAPAVDGEVHAVKAGDRIPLGTLAIEVYETGGHTAGSLTYRVGPYLFVGDALFAGSVGGTAGDAAFENQQRALAEEIFPLGDDLIVCPGHGPMSVVGVERRYNPFFE